MNQNKINIMNALRSGEKSYAAICLMECKGDIDNADDINSLVSEGLVKALHHGLFYKITGQGIKAIKETP